MDRQVRNHSALLAQCVVGFKDVVRHKPPERGEEIVIQRASDDCQAVLLHCRCDADVRSSFSPLHCVSSSSAFFSCPLYFPSLRLLIPFPPSCLLFTLSALSVGIFLSLSPLSPSLFRFFFFFLYSSLHLSIFPLLSSSLNPLSGDEWVEWSIVPWRLLCHPLLRWVQTSCACCLCVWCVFVCTYMCVYLLSYKYINLT